MSEYPFLNVPNSTPQRAAPAREPGGNGAPGSGERVDGGPLSFWIDLENITCITFFGPIIRRLRELGHRVEITYRFWPEMPELLRIHSLAGQQIGTFGGRKRLRKIQKGLVRAVRLAIWARGKRIALAIGFGARPQAVCCGLLRIPAATIIDYEHVSIEALKLFCNWIFVSAEVGREFWEARGVGPQKLVRFPGLKEDVYARGHTFDTGLKARLGISPDKTVALIRPPAEMAHYHHPGSEIILRAIVKYLAADPSVVTLLIPRVRGQSDRSLLVGGNIRELRCAVNGLDLIGLADLVVSGGGTMVREAAALGVPAYSCFTGPLGAIDARLSREGRLVLVRAPDQVRKIACCQVRRRPGQVPGDSSALNFFVERFIRLAQDAANDRDRPGAE